MEVAERHHISPLLVATAVVTRLPHYTKHGKKQFQELLDKDMTTLAHHFRLFKKDPTKHRQMGSPLSTAIWMTLNKNNVEYQKFVQNLMHLQHVLGTVQPTNAPPRHIIPSEYFQFDPALKAYPWTDIIHRTAPKKQKLQKSAKFIMDSSFSNKICCTWFVWMQS